MNAPINKNDIFPGVARGNSPSEMQAHARALLAEEFRITAAFVRVPTLSKVLGIAPGTIYAAMRNGRFCIPHRKINEIPCVRFEDLVTWYCEQEADSTNQPPTRA